MSTEEPTFARQLIAIGEACRTTLGSLYEVVQAQQRSLLDLIAAGGGGAARAPSSTTGALAAFPATPTGGAEPAAAATEAAAESEASAAAEGAATAAPPDLTAERILALGLDAAKGMAGVSADVAIALLEVTTVHAVGLALHNVVAQQQQLAMLAQAVLSTEAANRLAGEARPRTEAAPAGAAAHAVAG